MKPVIAVAAGCMVNAAGEVLIAQRPAGKIAAGQWEFPGGKIERGETAHDALARELHEELGVTVRAARPLIRIMHDYSDRTVVLDTWQVTQFDGEPQGREGQAFAWVLPERLNDYPLLAADRPIVTALQLPADYVFTPAAVDAKALLAGLPYLPQGALLRLRLPAFADADYADLARRLAPLCREIGLHLMLDRDPALSVELDAGWHARAAQLRELRGRPVSSSCYFAASVHNLQELELAVAADLDFVVIGTVRATRSHPGAAALGWEGFAALSQQANRPVYAIGGVGPADHVHAFGHYAQGVAGISAYWSRSSS